MDKYFRPLGQKGFTLVEILVATALGLVALASFVAFNRFQLFALSNQATQVDVQTTARSVLDLFAREVRRAGMDPTCSKAFEAIATASTEEVRIQSDLDGSGAIDATNEDIIYRYNFETDAVERVANGFADILLADLDLSGSELIYFDAAGNQLQPAVSTGGLNAAQRATVRRVRMELAVADSAVDPLNSQPLRARMSTDVNLRNRFFLASTACP